MTLTCGEYLQQASDELAAANAAAGSLDISQGVRAGIPTMIEAAMHALNAHTAALMALTVGTRTEP